MISKNMSQKMKKQCTSAIFHSKLLFAIDLWGGMSKANLKKIQALQDKASKLALGSKHENKTPSQQQKLLGWLSAADKVTYATHRSTHAVIHDGSLPEMFSMMPLNQRHIRIAELKKLGPKPRVLNSTARYRSTF